MTAEHSFERRLTTVEAQIGSLTSTISRIESNSRMLSDVEKVVLEMRGEVKLISTKIERLQVDHKGLEEDTYKVTAETKKEVSDIVNTIVSAINNMTVNFKEAVEGMARTHSAQIQNDIEPRLKAVEKKSWTLTGGLALGGFLLGIAVPFILGLLK